ncbi:MAG: VIT and VWA domain-containing protein [Polyangiaceae bacterium]|nr:VIT and VWA domain-containing protein [Polyangiaceae bacterium]
MTMNRSELVGTSGEAMALLGVEVRTEVVAGHASSVVRQRYRNDEKKPIEALYTFPLPSKAILIGFSMSVLGRRLEGEVHEREEAFRRYDDAITAGHGGALLEQERPNVFTANVGNLLPGEETTIEIQYVEPVVADEGAVRWSVPTLVAPRYIPGVPNGDRTAHGVTDPTDRVPDADRISPPIGDVAYGLALDLTFDLGADVDVESPSHSIVVTKQDGRTHVAFSQREVALDRDVIVIASATSARSAAAPLASVLMHRKGAGAGMLALTIVPDLGSAPSKHTAKGRNFVFVLDRSGSMGGTSMTEARMALRLCLRQLREGDRFEILAFDNRIESFAQRLTPFTQATLTAGDAWLEHVDARGGTELLGPMLEAAKLAPDGVIVVLTDGQVGNEDEILAAFLKAQTSARVYSFGIGTNVSGALLHALADKTGGAVEMIHPGERIDEKVIAQFARATALRVTNITIKTRGIELAEIAPAEPRSLVDSEPFCLFATYEVPGHGAIEIRGQLESEPFYLEVPVDLADASDRPVVAKLWAQARIVDLERAIVTGRRAETMKDRIVKLATFHGVSSKYTSFVVIEKRTGDRRATGQPETRVVAVSAPAGWDRMKSARVGRAVAFASAPAAPAPMMAAARMRPAAAPTPSGFAPMPAARAFAAPSPAPSAFEQKSVAEADPILVLLSQQTASGLWEEPGRDSIALTADALLKLSRLGLSTAHAVYGAQLKKAVDALLDRFTRIDLAIEPQIRELALGVAWLVASGRRTRRTVEDAVRCGGHELAALAAVLGDEHAVRARVDTLVSATNKL